MIKELTAGLDAATTAADSMRNFTEVTIATKFRGGKKKKEHHTTNSQNTHHSTDRSGTESQKTAEHMTR